MNVSDYEDIRKEFNYVIIHSLIDSTLKGSAYSRIELARLMSITFDLTSPINRNLAKLYNSLMTDIVDNPNRRVDSSELSSETLYRIYSLKELRELAKEHGVIGRTKMDVKQLATAILEAN